MFIETDWLDSGEDTNNLDAKATNYDSAMHFLIWPTVSPFFTDKLSSFVSFIFERRTLGRTGQR